MHSFVACYEQYNEPLLGNGFVVPFSTLDRKF